MRAFKWIMVMMMLSSIAACASNAQWDNAYSGMPVSGALSLEED